jgi:predicted nuclease of restriction endonuclease-like (RecB) superfamily
MRQFYEAYRHDQKVSALLRQLPWTHNLIILSQSKRPEEREFYLRLAIQEKWSSRELERQFKTALFERSVLNPAKVTPVVTQSHPTAFDVFRDAYLVEFLNLPEGHAEADLHQVLLQHLKNFLIELGRDFCFVGSEYPCRWVDAIVPWIYFFPSRTKPALNQCSFCPGQGRLSRSLW